VIVVFFFFSFFFIDIGGIVVHHCFKLPFHNPRGVSFKNSQWIAVLAVCPNFGIAICFLSSLSRLFVKCHPWKPIKDR